MQPNEAIFTLQVLRGVIDLALAALQPAVPEAGDPAVSGPASMDTVLPSPEAVQKVTEIMRGYL